MREEKPREQDEISEGLESVGVVHGNGPRVRPRSARREGENVNTTAVIPQESHV